MIASSSLIAPHLISHSLMILGSCSSYLPKLMMFFYSQFIDFLGLQKVQVDCVIVLLLSIISKNVICLLFDDTIDDFISYELWIDKSMINECWMNECFLCSVGLLLKRCSAMCTHLTLSPFSFFHGARARDDQPTTVMTCSRRFTTTKKRKEVEVVVFVVTSSVQ